MKCVLQGIFVSILVLVDVPLEVNDRKKVKKKKRVSILVLVDVPLEEQNHIYTIPDYLCFNPCFSGCASRSISVCIQ